VAQSAVPTSASREAAASAAAHRVLSTLFPDRAATFEQFYTAVLAGIPESPQKREGVSSGRAVVERLLMVRSADLSDLPISAPTGTGPGAWVPTPPAFASYLLPEWAHVTPFAMLVPYQFRPGGPPTLDSTTYAEHYNEVPFPDYVYGHSTFSAAAARVLARFFDTDDVAFATGSDFSSRRVRFIPEVLGGGS